MIWGDKDMQDRILPTDFKYVLRYSILAVTNRFQTENITDKYIIDFKKQLRIDN